MQFLPGHIALHEARSVRSKSVEGQAQLRAVGSWDGSQLGAPSGKSKALPSRFFRFRLPVDRAVTGTALDTVLPHVGQLDRAVRI